MASIGEDLVSRIQAWMEREQFGAGERIGTERELAEIFAVSRSAVRSALAIMEANDVIQRSMGRTGGIFIPSHRVERQLDTIEGVPSALRRQGIVSTTRVLSFTISVASPLESRNLQIDASANVYRLLRVREADGIPLSLDHAVLPAQVLPRLMESDMTGSLYDILAERYGQRVVEAEERIDVVGATAVEASHLQIEPGSPVLSIWRTSQTQTGTRIEFAHDVFRADRTRIQSRRYGGRWKHLAQTPRESDARESYPRE